MHQNIFLEVFCKTRPIGIEISITIREGIELIKPIQVLLAPSRMANAPANAAAIPGKVDRNASKYRSL